MLKHLKTKVKLFEYSRQRSLNYLLTFLLRPKIIPKGAINWRSLHPCSYDEAINFDMGGRVLQSKGREGGKNSKQKIWSQGSWDGFRCIVRVRG